MKRRSNPAVRRAIQLCRISISAKAVCCNSCARNIVSSAASSCSVLLSRDTGGREEGGKWTSQGCTRTGTERLLQQAFGPGGENMDRTDTDAGTEPGDPERPLDQNGPERPDRNGLDRLDRNGPDRPDQNGMPKSCWPYLDTHGLPEALDWTMRIVSARSSFLAWF